MEVIKLLLVATLGSVLIGQLVRVPIFSESGSITASDVLVLIVDASFLIYALLISKSFKVPPKIFYAVLLFFLAALSSLIFAGNFFAPKEIAIASVFLLRFFSYFLIAVVVFNIVKKQQITNWINLLLAVGVIFTSLGFLQLLTVSDFSSLTKYGWDPHQNRITSTFLDPNFAGFIFVTLLVFSIAYYLYQKKKIYLVLAAIYFIALILTFSRSSYLSALVAAAAIGLVKSPKFLITFLLIFALTFAGVSQVRARIVGAFTFDKTAQSRIESWQKAITVFLGNPIFGVGFNTYRFAQAKYGFFSSENPLGSHSGSGTDSSLLLVAATTGVFGSFFFLIFLFSIFRLFKKNIKSHPLSLASLATFFALLIHSQFVNSFFFPQIMFIFWFIAGLVLVYDS